MKIYKTNYRVYYEDTDAGGVVFYGNYLKFAERSRSDMLRLSGVNNAELAAKTGLFFVVRNVNIDYLAPARLDDMLEVVTTIMRVGKTSVDMTQDFTNQNGQAIAKMKVQIVCVKNERGKSGEGKIKSAAMPEELAEFFGKE
jgi:acyl-CoA thioester hydrolase